MHGRLMSQDLLSQDSLNQDSLSQDSLSQDLLNQTLLEQDSSSYLNGKCEVRHRNTSGDSGVFARSAIEPFELIGVWSGHIVNADGLERLRENIRRHTVQVEEGLYLASFGPNEPPDFINHSCEPNAGLSGQIAVVAMRPIQPGEEVTIDYAMCDGSPYDEFVCTCGSKVCRGSVSGEDWRIPNLRTRYAGYFSPYLQRRINALQRDEGSLPEFAKAR